MVLDAQSEPNDPVAPMAATAMPAIRSAGRYMRTPFDRFARDTISLLRVPKRRISPNQKALQRVMISEVETPRVYATVRKMPISMGVL